MMIYVMSSLDKRIFDLYHWLKITEPWQINVRKISEKLNVWLHFANISGSIGRKGMYSIMLNSTQPIQRQWECFGREMGHLLEGEGNYLEQPQSAIEKEEAQADRFSLSFCIPTFMLLQMNLPEAERQAVSFIARTFCVTYGFAKRKYEEFKHRLFGEQLPMVHSIKYLLNDAF